MHEAFPQTPNNPNSKRWSVATIATMLAATTLAACNGDSTSANKPPVESHATIAHSVQELDGPPTPKIEPTVRHLHHKKKSHHVNLKTTTHVAARVPYANVDDTNYQQPVVVLNQPKQVKVQKEIAWKPDDSDNAVSASAAPTLPEPAPATPIPAVPVAAAPPETTPAPVPVAVEAPAPPVTVTGPAPTPAPVAEQAPATTPAPTPTAPPSESQVTATPESPPVQEEQPVATPAPTPDATPAAPSEPAAAPEPAPPAETAPDPDPVADSDPIPDEAAPAPTVEVSDDPDDGDDNEVSGRDPDDTIVKPTHKNPKYPDSIYDD